MGIRRTRHGRDRRRTRRRRDVPSMALDHPRTTGVCPASLLCVHQAASSDLWPGESLFPQSRAARAARADQGLRERGDVRRRSGGAVHVEAVARHVGVPRVRALHYQLSHGEHRQDAEPEVPAWDGPDMITQVATEAAVWGCTTCGWCEEGCPVGIEHIQRIVDMRRYDVLMESRFPQEVTGAFKGIEVQGNPWGLAQEKRAEWAKDLDIPEMAEIEDSSAID